jgi:hypothetical protein
MKPVYFQTDLLARGGSLRMGLAMGRARMREVGTSSFFLLGVSCCRRHADGKD